MEWLFQYEIYQSSYCWQSLFFIFAILVCVLGNARHSTHVEVTGMLWESVLSSYHVGPGDPTQVISLGTFTH